MTTIRTDRPRRGTWSRRRPGTGPWIGPSTGAEDDLARGIRRSARSDIALVLTPVPGGLRVVASDPPSLATTVGSVIPVHPSMSPIIGLLVAGHLRWSLFPPTPGMAHAALVGERMHRDPPHLFLVATFDRARVLSERDLATVGTPRGGFSAEAR